MRPDKQITRPIIVLGCLILGSSFSFAQDATNVPMSTVFAPSYCSSIDGVDYSSQQYFTSASDVAAKTGNTIMSQNAGNACCTAAKPWNGSSCATLACPPGTENVAGTCKATANSCAAIGMMLVGGSCQAAAPSAPFNISTVVGKWVSRKGRGDIYDRWYTEKLTVISPTQVKGVVVGDTTGRTTTTIYAITYDSQSYYYRIPGSSYFGRIYPDSLGLLESPPYTTNVGRILWGVAVGYDGIGIIH